MKGARAAATTIPTMKAKVVATIVPAMKVKVAATYSEGGGGSTSNTCHKG